MVPLAPGPHGHLPRGVTIGFICQFFLREENQVQGENYTSCFFSLLGGRIVTRARPECSDAVYGCMCLSLVDIRMVGVPFPASARVQALPPVWPCCWCPVPLIWGAWFSLLWLIDFCLNMYLSEVEWHPFIVSLPLLSALVLLSTSCLHPIAMSKSSSPSGSCGCLRGMLVSCGFPGSFLWPCSACAVECGL